MYSSTLDVLGRLGGEQGRDVQGRIKELKAAHVSRLRVEHVQQCCWGLAYRGALLQGWLVTGRTCSVTPPSHTHTQRWHVEVV